MYEEMISKLEATINDAKRITEENKKFMDSWVEKIKFELAFNAGLKEGKIELWNKYKVDYKSRRIFGTEIEYGLNLNQVNWSVDGLWLENGGLVYKDCGHPEYASPESRNTLDALKYSKAGELIIQELFPEEMIIKNNVDSHGNTFGAHESYSYTKGNLLDEFLMPFLITRQIFAGSGKINFYGQYEISQRSSFLGTAKNVLTTHNRPIINTKDESHSEENIKRLHLILGDANMFEVAEFLKLGTTGLVLDLMESEARNKLDIPSVYPKRSPVAVVKSISQEPGIGFMTQRQKFIDAVNVQYQYFKLAKSELGYRDPITQQVLDLWGYVLENFEDESKLFGKVDWVTKKALINQYQQEYDLPDGHTYLRNIDLQYHDINQQKGLFYNLQKNGLTDRLLSDEEIIRAKIYAPTNTRAFIRGNIVKQFKEKNIVSVYDERGINWTYIPKTAFFSVDSDTKKIFLEEFDDVSILNPFDNYIKLVNKLKIETRKK